MSPSTTVKATSRLTPGADLGRRWVTVVSELVKARLSSLVVVTTGVGYYMGSPGAVNLPGLLATLAGTGFLAGGAAALNQYLERDLDARMERTRHRPLPSGQIRPATALVFGIVAALFGLAVLVTAVGRLPAALGALTLFIYLAVYTPLKRVTTLNTVVGSVPGALPPLLGWTAARGTMETDGWTLFAILVFWQLPHFLAIAWICREDYARAGLAMLPVRDPQGLRTSAYALAHSLGLVAVSLSPFVRGLAGWIYLAGALGLGALFVTCAWGFARGRTDAVARRLFYASILYLPLLLGLMVLDKN